MVKCDDDRRALCIYEKKFYEVKIIEEQNENTPKHERLIKWHGFKKSYEEWRSAFETPLLRSTCAFKYKEINKRHKKPKKQISYSLWKCILEGQTPHNFKAFDVPLDYIYTQDRKNIINGKVIELQADIEKNANQIFDDFDNDRTFDADDEIWWDIRAKVIGYLKRLMQLAVVKKWLLFDQEIGYAETWLQNRGYLESNADTDTFLSILPPAFVVRFLIKLPELMQSVGLNNEQESNLKLTVSQFCDWLFRNSTCLSGTTYECIKRVKA